MPIITRFFNLDGRSKNKIKSIISSGKNFRTQGVINGKSKKLSKEETLNLYRFSHKRLHCNLTEKECNFGVSTGHFGGYSLDQQIRFDVPDDIEKRFKLKITEIIRNTESEKILEKIRIEKAMLPNRLARSGSSQRYLNNVKIASDLQIKKWNKELIEIKRREQKS